MEKKRILICVPTADRQVDAELVDFLCAMARFSEDPEYPYDFGITTLSEVTPIEHARNVCVSLMLEHDYEWLWFLDADVIPPDNATDLLKIDDAPIVAAVVHKVVDVGGGNRSITWMVYEAHGTDSYRTAKPPEEGMVVKEVDAVATAAMLIHRVVLEDPRMNMGRGKQAFRQVFRTLRKPGGEVIRGEDIDFCRRARSFGHKIVVDFNVCFGHRKTMDLRDVQRMWAKLYQPLEAVKT